MMDRHRNYKVIEITIKLLINDNQIIDKNLIWQHLAFQNFSKNQTNDSKTAPQDNPHLCLPSMCLGLGWSKNLDHLGAP